MKRFRIMISLCVIYSLFVIPSLLRAQDTEVPKSLGADVSQRLGIDTDITIEYSRPGVKGRKIWGELVPFGLAPGTGYSDNKPFPWRAGANKNTTIEISKDILVEGKKLPAGKYGIHMIPTKTTWTIIFSKNSELWGSYKYNKEEDALRVTVTPAKAPHQEWLLFGFEDLAGTSATAYLLWEECKVPFAIKLP